MFSQDHAWTEIRHMALGCVVEVMEHAGWVQKWNFQKQRLEPSVRRFRSSCGSSPVPASDHTASWQWHVPVLVLRLLHHHHLFITPCIILSVCSHGLLILHPSVCSLCLLAIHLMVGGAAGGTPVFQHLLRIIWINTAPSAHLAAYRLFTVKHLSPLQLKLTCISTPVRFMTS